jgi:hypothetical protein
MHREPEHDKADAALAAAEAEWRATLAPAEPGPGDEFFRDLPLDAELDPGQRAALRDIRGALAEIRPVHVRPENTNGSLDGYGVLRLAMRHQMEPDVEISLVYGDGYLALAWPDGEEHANWKWSPLLRTAVWALLSGRNLQTYHLRMNRLYAVDTEIWDERGQRFKLRRRWRMRQAVLGLLPLLPTTKQTCSISFDRSPAIRHGP